MYEHEFKNDPINPNHYKSGKFEVIEIIQDQLTPEQFEGYCLGNALKYICRAGKKNPDKKKEDIQKATWYLNKFCE